MQPPQILAAGATQHRYPDAKVTMFLTYALLVALSLFAIAALPRAVARFLSLEARSLGWTLRHSPPRPRDPLQRVPTAKRAADWNRSTYEKQLATSGSDQARDWTARYAIQAPRVAPRHIPSLRTLLFPLSRQFCKTICGYTVGQIFILASYAALIGFGILFHSNPVTNPKRAGWIAVSQYPVAVLLANKNSVLGFLVGKGYEKLNYLHRWAGKLMCISALFHVVSYLVLWTKNGSLTAHVTKPIGITGIAVVGGFTFLAISSLPAVRNRMWTIFSCTHFIGFCVVMIATPYHVPETLIWCLISSGIFGLDLLIRLIQSHYVTATMHYVPELKATRVVIPELRSGWRAGQHIRLTVLSTAMGIAQTMESHPFTVASASEDDEGMVLYCHEAGDWTRSLATLARGGSTGTGRIREAFGAGQRVNVLVQGPYGGPGGTLFSSYSAAMFICGGSGITFGLSATEDVIRDAFDRRSRLRLVDLVWSVQDPSAIVPMLPAFTRLLSQAESITSVSLRISVHYTRAFATPTTSVEDIEFPYGLTLNPGRPELADMLSATIGCTSALKKSVREGVHGVIVAVCAPPEFANHVRQVENAIRSKVRAAVGGVELLEEAFAW